MKLDNNINKESPFKVPDDYFNNFYDNLQRKIEEKSETKTINFNFRKHLIKVLKPVIGIAAIFIIVFTLIFIQTNNEEMLVDNYQTEILEDEILYSLLTGIDDMTFYELLNESNEITEEYDDDYIEEYVYSNISDYELYSTLY